MTRRMVYGFGLWLTIACTAMTVASIVMPRWISFSPNDKRNYSMGLHRRCSTITGKCTSFPDPKLCNTDEYFCAMWRTVAFLISFDVVIELCALVSFVVIISGGVQRRSTGWQVVCSILLFGGIVQCAGMAIVASLFHTEERFFQGWFLDTSFALCTASWSILVLTSFGIAATAYYLEEEGGYELIPNFGINIETEQDEQ
ncbi:hypothetical protein K504DRAFT_448159 [Pleomassaria siparia CBS 279.74]|uniref:Uncharacterized protein n=1 Tax=Pleomassaria siparia CBS 279.74 TaxID=1314801 RepID=A0A6G1K169_9PLEO|nr:hypothetical protein K504DRAFT_448159 [Pleomassaria siparia CBS 279.74]